MSFALVSAGGGFVSLLDLTWRAADKGTFFLTLSESDAFWLTAELLEFSESEELDSLPELEELLDEEPELVEDVDSELVACLKVILSLYLYLIRKSNSTIIIYKFLKR